MKRRPDRGKRGADRSRGRRGAYWRSLSSAEVVGMLDRLTDGVVVLGSDWRLRYVNQRAAAMLGRPRDDLLGRHAWTEFPDGGADAFRLAFERAVRDGEPLRIVEHYPPSDRWFECRAFPQEQDLVIVFRDVTGMQRIERELREYADRMSEAERIARFGVWEWEIATGQVLWSDELHRIYGLEPGTFGGTVDDFVGRLHPDDRDRVWGHVSRAIETGDPFAFEERILREDGQERLLLSQGRVIAGPDGAAGSLVGVCHDVTERAQAERALGVSERRMRAIIDNTPSIVAVKDLSGRYLMSNAETGRVLGVDPATLIGRECNELFPADLAERFRANDTRATAEGEPVYDEAVLLRDGEPRTYVTVTFALPDDAGLPAETCTIGTDVTERRERETERRERLAWKQRISSALDDGRLAVFAQPVIELATGRQASRELLVRMQADDGSGHFVDPVVLFAAAERFGFVQRLDVWMVGQALRLRDGVPVEVNLSAVTMCDPIAMKEIVGLLAASPESSANLVFEITETAAVEHLDAARNFAAELTELGCGLALDDFGTGFGSFTYLRELPLRYLKIDASFVTGLTGSSHDRRVVQSIIGIARQFDLMTIAEGVEDEATLDLLRDMGSHYAQGFHLGRPEPLGAAASVR